MKFFEGIIKKLQKKKIDEKPVEKVPEPVKVEAAPVPKKKVLSGRIRKMTHNKWLVVVGSKKSIEKSRLMARIVKKILQGEPWPVETPSKPKLPWTKKKERTNVA